MSLMLKAIPAAPGIALGKVFWLREELFEIAPRAADPLQEGARLEQARSRVRASIQKVRDSLQAHPEEAAIFEAHLLMLDDPDLLDLAGARLTQGAEYAWDTAIQGYAGQIESLADEYLRARAADVRDVGRQVLRVLLGKPAADLSDLPEPVILLARDLTPSDTGRLDRSRILGFATQEGTSTAHTAILARTLGLPAVVGCGASLAEIPQGALVALDGLQGTLLLDPDAGARAEVLSRQAREQAQKAVQLAEAGREAVTTDGRRVEMAANVGRLEDVAPALAHGAEGVGLLRTEFLYMERRTPPDEAAQLLAYRAILALMEKRPVVIRTLDIGGDKYPAYMDLGQESNPFLGWRAIRVCLERPDFFKTQLRAILRAAAGHDVRIMFPMIATLDELRQAKSLLAEASRESGVTGPVQVGMMVEIPSVVQMADRFAAEVDFFSIGTNDLTQYTFAADRTNPKVAGLAEAIHPAILRQIRTVIEAGHSQGKWVGVCGELAGDSDAVPILLGLGLDEFSMSAAALPSAKEAVRRWSMPAARQLAEETLALESAAQVRQLVHERSAALFPG